MSRITRVSMFAYVVTLAMAASVLAQTRMMQDAKKKKTPAYGQRGNLRQV
jgi:hypothetical protein